MKYVYTFGVFDLLHAGHIELLNDARKLGDELIVGLFPDKVAKSFKRQPVIPYDQRLLMLKSLRIVGDVIVQKEISPINNIKALHKQKVNNYIYSNSLVVAKGPGANWEQEYSAVGEQTGVLCLLLPYHKGSSTSDIIQKIKSTDFNDYNL